MSCQTEAIPPPDIVFKGTDGNECEAFVVAIRDFAFATGRDDDHSWMLRFATTRLRGKALRWHARLDSPVTDNWGLFVQALFDQYPSVEEDSEAETATPVWSTTTFSPGPSMATLPLNQEANRSVAGRSIPIFPSSQAGHEESRDLYVSHERTFSARPYDASSAGQQIGLLRIISVDVDGTSIPQYVWWDHCNYRGISSSPTMTTINRHEALIVTFLPSSAPHTIGCLNSRGGRRTLTLSWAPSPAEEYYKICSCNISCTTVTPASSTRGFVAKHGTFWRMGLCRRRCLHSPLLRRLGNMKKLDLQPQKYMSTPPGRLYASSNQEQSSSRINLEATLFTRSSELVSSLNRLIEFR